MTATRPGVTICDFTVLLLDTLGHCDGEFTSLLYKDRAEQKHTAVAAPADAVTAIAKIPTDANIFFGVNPVRGPVRQNEDGRGKAEDVTRLAGLPVDLDIKPGGCASLDIAKAIIANLSSRLRSRPSVTVDSGHGLHAYWKISDGAIGAGFTTGAARALLKRWGRLVQVEAQNLSAHADTVFDLPRMMRVPGSLNNKVRGNGTQPIPVIAATDTGVALTVAEIDERLTKLGVRQEDDDTADAKEQSPPQHWRFGAVTHGYVTKIIDAIGGDGPQTGKGRHQWVLKQAVRLACAYLLGVISETDWGRAQKLLDTRLGVLRAATGETVPTYEVPAAFRWAVTRAATKTAQAARKDLGIDDEPAGGADHADPDDNADGADDNVAAFKLPDGQRATDVGNANRLLRHAGGRIRYVHAWGKWIIYRRGRWIVDEKDALVTETAKQVAKGLYQLAAKTATTEPDAAKLVWAWALKSDNSSAIAAMIRMARGVPGLLVNHEDLDADPWLLNVANGTIDLRTGKLRPHNPADLCTLQAPVAYDPHAAAPLWETCVQCWQPDDDVRDYLQVRAGAGATGIPTETVDVDYGHGGNGKSKFHGAVQYVLGPYATVPHKSLLVTGRFEQHATVIADLFRKRLAVASETKAAEALDDEQVKNLTGGDRLKGRRMREDPWEFWPTHTLVMFSNHKPTIRGRDEGIWRRLRLVPWTVTIAEEIRDDGLAVKLQAEATGILRWIVDGARRFYDADARLSPPDAVRGATEQYRREEDIAGRFVDEVLTIAPHTWCYSIDIKAELDDWCAEQDIATPPTMNEIAAILRERGCNDGGRKQVHGKRSTIWHGVSVTQTSRETP